MNDNLINIFGYLSILIFLCKSVYTQNQNPLNPEVLKKLEEKNFLFYLDLVSPCTFYSKIQPNLLTDLVTLKYLEQRCYKMYYHNIIRELKGFQKLDNKPNSGHPDFDFDDDDDDYYDDDEDYYAQTLGLRPDYIVNGVSTGFYGMMANSYDYQYSDDLNNDYMDYYDSERIRNYKNQVRYQTENNFLNRWNQYNNPMLGLRVIDHYITNKMKDAKYFLELAKLAHKEGTVSPHFFNALSLHGPSYPHLTMKPIEFKKLKDDKFVYVFMVPNTEEFRKIISQLEAANKTVATNINGTKTTTIGTTRPSEPSTKPTRSTRPTTQPTMPPTPSSEAITPGRDMNSTSTPRIPDVAVKSNPTENSPVTLGNNQILTENVDQPGPNDIEKRVGQVQRPVVKRNLTKNKNMKRETTVGTSSTTSRVKSTADTKEFGALNRRIESLRIPSTVETTTTTATLRTSEEYEQYA